MARPKGIISPKSKAKVVPRKVSAGITRAKTAARKPPPKPPELLQYDLDARVLPYHFYPRDYQGEFLRAMAHGYRRAILVWHRRAGKDKTIINYLVTQAYQHVGTYFYFFPTYSQGRKIIWDGMDKDGFKFLDHIPEFLRAKVNATEMKITLVNGSIIQIIGSDQIDSVVGTNPIGCVFSEYSIQNPAGWDYVRPILRENGGWAVFAYTPRGMNHGYDLYHENIDNPEWYCSLLTVLDTGVMTQKDVDDEIRQGMSPALAKQEFFCSFEAALEGAYFSHHMTIARQENRIGSIPAIPSIPVDTWWDIGWDDSTTIWFSQDVGREIHFIYYYEDREKDLGFYARKVKELADLYGWFYGRHVGPHDLDHHELGTGKTRAEMSAESGLVFTDIIPRITYKEDSIEAARRILPICYFNSDTTARGVSCLSSYQKTWDAKNKVFKERPKDNWAVHGADAFQTFAMGHTFAKHRKVSADSSSNTPWAASRRQRFI